MRNNPPGLYPKYVVEKDGEPVDHNVFVLSPETDKHALEAIRAYAESCRKENPELAIDLLRWEANIRENELEALLKRDEG